MKADQSLFVLDLNERRSDSTDLVWSIRIDKLNKALEREKENTKSKVHDLTLQKDIQDSKMKANTSLLQHKIEILNKQNK